MSKKKIGIMSMQRIVNYGSFLQAYSLKKNIEKITGKEVEFVDFNIGKPKISEKKEFAKKVKKNLNIVRYLKKERYEKNFKKAYNECFLPMLGISNKKNYYPKDIETLVLGSDEVFNCLQSYPVGYSTDLFGKNYENVNVISYAGSFGFVTYEDLKKYKIDNEIGSYFKKFKSISVRDNNSYSIISKLTNKKALINLDPVLVTTLDKEMTNKTQYKDYILLYVYSNRLNKKERKIIKKYAKYNNKIIISIGGYEEIANYNLVVNPFDIYSFFKNADLVITDTFHGSIFSIKTHANYYTIIRKSNENKLLDMLKRVGQENRIITDINDIFKEKENDFTITDKIIKKETDNMINYLKNNL